jgi:outer membrane usher protein FimD/PapC
MRRDIPLLAWVLTWALTLLGAMRALGQTVLDAPTASTAPVAQEDEFDLDFLNPALTDKKDRKTIQTLGLTPPGVFTVAVEVNAVNKGSMNIKFVRPSRQENAQPCFTAKDINTFQFKTELLSAEAKALVNGKALPVSKKAEGVGCLSIKAIIQEAFYEYDRGDLILKITAPQAALQRQKADRFAPQEFSDGENAGFVNYYANAYQSE